MHMVNVVLFLGAFFLALFVFLFVGGAVIHLARLITDMLAAIRKPKIVKEEVAQPAPAARPAHPHRALQAESYVDASAAYARA